MAFRSKTESLVTITAAILFAGSVSSCKCGGSVNGSGIIRSPNFPNNYPNSCNCWWTLEANPGDAEVLLQILNVSTNPKHYVYIHSTLGNKLWLSGRHPPLNVTLLAPVNVDFEIDQRESDAGFEISFSTITSIQGQSNSDKGSPKISPNITDFECTETESANDSSTFYIFDSGVIGNKSNALISIKIKSNKEITLKIGSYEFEVKDLTERRTREKLMMETKNCTGVIVGATVGTLTFVAAMALIALIARRRSQRKTKSRAQVDGTAEHGSEEIAMEDNPIYG